MAKNMANGSPGSTARTRLVSVFNFHYARPPEAVAMNEASISPSASTRPDSTAPPTPRTAFRAGNF